MPCASSKKCIMTFIGPVGVGKSTQIRLLKNYLGSKNIKVVETFIKSTHALTYILSRSLIALGASEEVTLSAGFTRLYPRKNLMKRLFALRCFFDTISISAKFFFTVYIPFCLGFTILVEEGLMMTLYTYLMALPTFFETEAKVPPFLPRLLGWVLKNNHLNVVLEAENEELNRRRKGRSYRQNESIHYISLQRKWIARLNLGDTIFMDTTNKSPTEVHKRIVMVLEKSALKER